MNHSIGPRGEFEASENGLAEQIRALGCYFERNYVFDASRDWRFSFAIPEHKIFVSYFVDCVESKRNAATLAGWRCFVFGPRECATGLAFRVLDRAIAARRAAKAAISARV